MAAVQPGRVEDLSMIMNVLAITKVPFAVKGGGHATNPKFSSTTGIQISMARFNRISKYVPGASSRDVEAGCLFDEVYRAIVPTGQNIVGGSAIAGVGIAGWLLGGGYSLKTNQYGLGIDNILGFRIVLPNGAIEDVTEQSNKELFEAVKGGGNNFGIVVQFTLKTHDQSPIVYGGLLVYGIEESEDVKDAIVDFVDNPRDPKAAIVAAFRYYNNPAGEQFKLTVQYFYDSPKPSDNPFQKFLDIPHTFWTGNGAGAGMEQTSYTNFDERLSLVNDSNCDIFERDFDNVGPDFNNVFSNFEPYSNDESNFANTKPSMNEIRSQVKQTHPPRAMAGVGENARGRWGNVMVSKYTRDIINEVEKQAKVSVRSTPSSSCV
ncbi:hypothetical protein BGY98DRAFT_992388 [Russula aff. rugulosa BPL654]|nr:hypothetical protein BGY98DRAFT_992388 [Russula aff. rugulosa BPL654]